MIDYLTTVEKASAVSFDLDSTLADTTHRQWMINREGYTDWEAYSLACVDDTDGPALPLAQYLTKLGVPLIICSARSEVARQLTMKWLRDREIYPWAVQLDDGTHSDAPHGVWKAQKLLELRTKLDREIAFHVDDWSEVATESKKVGIKTILVHQPNSNFVDEKLA